MSYLKWEEVVTPDFMRRPGALVIEAGNGQGKTHAMAEFSVYLQKLNVFDSIYFFQYSHKGCQNVLNKIVGFGGWAVWYIGMERFCPLYNRIKLYVDMGIPPTYFCYTCPYFKNKSKAAYRILESQLASTSKTVIMPGLTSYSLVGGKICTHPLIKAFTVNPAKNLRFRQAVNETPIFVVPSELFFQFGLVQMWEDFSRRQKKTRKTLFIIDEADIAFYNSIHIEVPEVSPTPDDYTVMKLFSSKTRNLAKILDVYPSVLQILGKAYEKRGIMVDDLAVQLDELLSKVIKEIRSFHGKRKKIVDYVVSNNLKTIVFRVVSVLESLASAPSLSYVLRTVERVGNTFVVENYEYGVELLLNPEFPWRHVWKILLTATFPTKKLLSSRLLSPKAKSVLGRVRYYTKTYENVYTTSVHIYEKDAYTLLNRNREVLNHVASILSVLKGLVEFYKEKFGVEPAGIAVWFGNSTQYSNFFKAVRRKLKIEPGRRYTVLQVYGVKCFFSYAGSEVSRGLDLSDYDISIVLGPLLRPPRNIGFLDVIDFGRAVAEVVQSAMRIVRSPRPSRPKLVALEESMLSPFYQQFYPGWFLDLLSRNYISIASTATTTARASQQRSLLSG